MKIKVEQKGDFNDITKWLKEVSSRDPSDIVEKIAIEGRRSLSSNTPRNTGETASGWKEKITSKGGITEVAWMNTAHPESNVNVAKLIEIGHGTGNGGYVPPRPYIKNAMRPIWDRIDNEVVKEMIK